MYGFCPGKINPKPSANFVIFSFSISHGGENNFKKYEKTLKHHTVKAVKNRFLI